MKKIKKIFIVMFFLLFSFTLIGCITKEDKKYSVLAPSGAPYIMAKGIGEKFDIEEVTGGMALPAIFTKGEKDIIFASANLGPKLYNKFKKENKEISYRPLFQVSANNLYIINIGSKEEITISNLEGKKLTGFGELAAPGVSIKYAFKELIDNKKLELEFVNAVSDLVPLILKDEVSLALLAEPVLSKIKAALTKKGKEFNVKKLIDFDSSLNNIFMANVYVNKKLTNNEINDIKKLFIENFNKMKNEKELYVESLKEDEKIKGLGVPLLKEILDKMGFICNDLTKLEHQEKEKEYFTKIKEINPDFIGGELPDSDYYFKAE